MILKDIKLSGFKSFYRKVSLDFGEGITAIVGPNGCGKSNVADAIRWVLGEQNPRVLRGKRMDDTIFKGTQSRRPLNMAEVAISFDNSDGLISLPYQEITISRKLFRSGESEYRINNSECRLKDVTDLILDIGVGKDAYSLIEQKMIDAILNGKSDERRRIVEEAAGVVKYKERRRLAVRKLDKTRLDLEQIQVLFDEVERSVRGLKRHVGKAKRHKAFRVREKEVEIFLARLRHEELHVREEAIKASLELLEDKKKNAAGEIQGLEADLREGKSSLTSKEESLNTTRERLKSRALDIKQLDERLVVLRERSVHRRDRIDRVEAEIEEGKNSRELLLKEQGELACERAGGAERLKELSGRLNQLESERSDAETTLRDESEKYRLGEERRLRKLETITEMKARLNALENEKNSLLEKRDRLETQLSEKRDEFTAIGGERGCFSAEVEELRTIVQKMSGKLDKLSQLKEKISQRSNISDREARKQQLQLNTVLSQLDMRQKWQEEFEGYPAGVSAIMRSKDDFPGILGPVGELFEIDDQFVRAIETGLWSYLKMIVTTDNMTALRAINYLRSGEKGVASFLSLEMLRTVIGRKLPRPPSWVIAIGADVVRCRPELNPLRDLLLGNLWIVPPPSAGEDVEEYFKAEARLVSLDGSLLKDEFVLWGGEDGKVSPLLLERSKAIEELQRESVSLKKALEKVDTDHRRLNQILVDAVGEHEKLDRRSGEEARSLREKEGVLLGLEREENFLQSEIKQLEEELQRVVSLCGSRERERSELLEALPAAGNAGEASDEKTPGGELDHFRERKDLLDREIEGFRVEDASLKSLLSEIEKRAKRLEKELTDRDQLLGRLAEEQTCIEGELLRFEEEKRDAEERRGTVASEVEEAEKELSAREEEIRFARAELDGKDDTAGRLRNEIEARAGEIQRLELEQNDMKNQMLSLKDRIRERYGIKLHEVPFQETVEGERVSELKHELQDLKTKLANLGHVNFVALEEYEGEEERLNVLRTQRDDLVEGKESLEKAIRKINRTARERFLETFELVRENFQETFRLLFRGGKADLIIADDGDPLECYIEMVAQPFGKRLESVDLLSGGERALTALALLFAIYQVKPSPFCILDEADAALDDSNVDRLIDMLKKFRGETQFIVVTHNKKTMSAADCLYGVTMEEPGISKVVSVTLGGNGKRVAGDSRGSVKEEERASV